jgi:serine/threonine-protein kinase
VTEGVVYSNRYAVERTIARGGMAEVYLARDQVLDRRVAVKVLFQEFARDPSFVERFRREAQSAALLNHPNIVAVYDWGQQSGTYFIVMEYVEGRSLRDLIRARGTVPTGQTAQIGAAIADALEFAHRNGVVHRDIKPGNVMLTADGEVKVTDFGIAAHPTDARQGLTQTGAVMGTATYFSPEQAQGFPVDGRTDVYALGVVLYEMITGVPPFTAESPVAVAMKHVREVPMPPSARVPDIAPDLERIILHALEKDVDHRYQSAEELRDDLVRFERGRPLAMPVGVGAGDVSTNAPTVVAARRPVARPQPQPEMWAQSPERRRWGTIIASIIGLGLLAAVIVFALFFLENDTKGNSTPLVGVPDVTTGNPEFTAAASQLEGLGFEVERVDRENPDVERDRVFQQDPEANTRARKGSTITLTVSSAQVTIPSDLVGQGFDSVQSTLTSLDLLANRQDRESADQAPNTVLALDPPGGTSVERGSTVAVAVAKTPQIPVPSVQGQDQNAASATLQNAGLQVQIQPAPHDTIPLGSAIGTNPQAGTKVDPGSTVQLIVSTGPTTVEIPNTVGTTQVEAQAALTSKGFSVAVSFGPGTDGVVVAQNPSGGMAPPGSVVAITVGDGT